MCVCFFSECICLTSYVLAQLCGDEATFTGCTSRSLLSLRPDSSLSVCSSSRQPDSHRSPAQMPWPTLHVCKRVCVKKHVCVLVCAHLLLALSRTASQFVTTLPHISVSSAFSPFPHPFRLASIFRPSFRRL